MRVTMVRYRRNQEVDKFVHEHIECEVSVAEDESPQMALKSAKAFVDQSLEDLKTRTPNAINERFAQLDIAQLPKTRLKRGK